MGELQIREKLFIHSWPTVFLLKLQTFSSLYTQALAWYVS